MTRGAHHIHRHVKRKNFERRLEKSLVRDAKKVEKDVKRVSVDVEDSVFKRGIDRLVLIIAFLAPLVELPQLLQIFMTKSAESVSLLTWAMFVVFGVPWLIYGIVHKEKPVIILYSLWIVIDSAIVAGILMYG
ncbi:MAG: SemiSWEET family transporter [archaeon]